MQLTFRITLNIERTDGKRVGRVAQAISEQVVQLLDERFEDETFLVGNTDHNVSLEDMQLYPRGRTPTPLVKLGPGGTYVREVPAIGSHLDTRA